MRNITPFFALFVFILLIGVDASAQQSQLRGTMPPEMQKGADFYNHISTTLNLSDEQKDQFKHILMDIAKYRKANIQSHPEDFQNFSEMFRGEKMDTVALKSMASARAVEREKMADFTRAKIIEFHDILTPDQRKSAMENLSEYFKKLMGGDDN